MQGTVRKRGASWQAILNVWDSAAGKRRQISSTHPTKAGAQRWITLTAAKYGCGEGAAHSMTVAELLQIWWDQKSPDWSPSNRRNMRNAIDKVLVPRFGETPVLKLRASDLDQWYVRLRRTVKPSTIRKYHGIMHSAFALAERYDWVPSNQVRKTSPPKLGRTPIAVPTLDELLLLTAACDSYDHRLGFAVHLAAVTGARRGEVLALRWSDFDDIRRVVRFWNAVILGDGDKATLKYGTKTGKERTVSLDDWTFEKLVEHRKNCEERARENRARIVDTSFLFSSEIDGSQPMSPDYLSSMYQRARKSVGLERVRLHDFRHFHATALLTSGVDVATVAGRLGHAGGGRMTLEVYAHFIEPADRRAAELAAQKLRRTE
jgi:integrase